MGIVTTLLVHVGAAVAEKRAAPALGSPRRSRLCDQYAAHGPAHRCHRTHRHLCGLRYEDKASAHTHAFSTLVFIELLRSFRARGEVQPLRRISLFTDARLVAASLALEIAAHRWRPLRIAVQTGTFPWADCVA
jgi:hypothetical protein